MKRQIVQEKPVLGTPIASKDCKLQQKCVDSSTSLVVMTTVVLGNVTGCHDNSGTG